MAAVTEVRQYTGSGPTSTAITNQRYAVTDAVNDTSNPVVRPTSGLAYSYVSTVALYATTGPVSTLNNNRYYSDGTSYGTGITVKGIQTNTYAQAASSAVDAAVYTAGTDVTTYTSGSPLSMTSAATSGTGRMSYYLRTQCSVASTAAGGTSTARTNSIIYDET